MVPFIVIIFSTFPNVGSPWFKPVIITLPTAYLVPRILTQEHLYFNEIKCEIYHDLN